MADHRLRSGLRAMPVRRFFARLLAESGVALRVATPLLVRMATEDALAEIAGSIRVTDSRLVSAIVGSLRELEREEPEEGVLVGSERGRLLVDVQRRVRESLGREGFVASGARGAVSALLRMEETGAGAFELFRDVSVLELDGWLRFATEDLRWIRALQRTMRGIGIVVRIVLPTPDLPLEASRQAHALERLVDAASRTFEDAISPRPLALGIASVFVAPDASSRDDCARVAVARARSEADQAAVAVDALLAAVRRGAAVEDLGIVVPNRGGASEQALVAALDAAELPHRGARSPLSQAPVVAAIRALLVAALEGTPDSPSALVSRYASRAAPEAMRVAVDGLRAAKTRRASVDALAEWIDALELALFPLDRAGPLLAADAPHDALAVRDLAARGREGRALEAIRGLLREIAEAPSRFGGAPLGVLAVSDLVFESLSADVARSGARAVGIRMGRLEEFEEEALELLVVVDANDGIFPSTDAPPVFVHHLIDKASSQERALVGEAEIVLATAGARSLVFVHRAFEGDEPLLLARVLQELSRPPLSLVLTSRGLRADGEHSAHAESGEELDELARRVASARAREAFFLDPERRASRDVGQITNLSEVGRHALFAATGGARPLATTTLEVAAGCAFAGYARAVLGARSAEEASLLTDRREEGTLVHQALAAAFGAAKEALAASPPVLHDVLTIGLAAASTIEMPTPSRATELVKARVLGAVARELERACRDEEWTFLVAEQEFGDDEGAWPALVVESASHDERVRLRGTIDRVDVARGDRSADAPVRVIDYKASARRVETAARDVGHTVFQVPLYALAARRGLGARSAEGAYLATSERQPKPLSPKRYAERERELLMVVDGAERVGALAAESALRVRRGELAPLPADEGACKYCDYDGICRKPRFAILAEEVEEGVS